MHNLRKAILEPALNKFNHSLATRLEKVNKATSEISKLFTDPKSADLSQIVDSYSSFLPGHSNCEKLEKLKYEIEPWSVEIETFPLQNFDETEITRFDCYPSLQTLFIIMITNPSSNAISERIFSNLEDTKTKKRATICQSKLSGLSVTSSNFNLVPTSQEVFQRFREIAPRKFEIYL